MGAISNKGVKINKFMLQMLQKGNLKENNSWNEC